MTKCDSCGQEVGNLYCAKCRAKVEGKTARIKFGKLIPLLFYDVINKRYVFGCTVEGCPCNKRGKCSTAHIKLPLNILHEFDGDNIVQQVCG